MSTSQLKFRFDKTLNKPDPDAKIKLDPLEVPDIDINLKIRPEHHKIDDVANLTASTFSINDLVALLEPTVMKIITTSIQDKINDQHQNRDNMIRQLVLDAWVRSGRGNITEDVTKIMQELRQCLPLNLTEVRDVSELRPAGWRLKDTPLDVAEILFRGIVKCANDQRAKVDLNIVFFKWLLQKKAAALSRDLMQVACYQHGGVEEFAVDLIANDGEVRIYLTQEVEEMLRVGRVKLDAKVQRYGQRLVEVAMHQGDWRIWPILR